MAVEVIAVDWSGAKKGARKKIWRAKAVVPGQLEELENGLNRDEVEAYLLREVKRTLKPIIGLDFAFSLPAWFLGEHGLASAHELWALADREAETWLENCEPPFWGRPGHPRPALPDHFRCTERVAPRIGGIGPKSAFQIGGAGGVGTGSLRGMPLLHRLHVAGFSVWPFDKPAWPRVVEIYPRLLTREVVKSNFTARGSHLRERYPRLDTNWRERAASCEDAFDAAVSALAMVEHRDRLSCLSQASERQVLLEGWIWCPPPSA